MSRHFLAILASGSRQTMLASVRAPTLVIHGSVDPLVSVEHGRDTANCVPNGRITVIEGMGHDLPLAVIPQVRSAIAGHCSNAGAEYFTRDSAEDLKA